MSYIQRSNYKQDKQIFIYPTVNETTRNVVIENTNVQLNSDGEREVPPGMFLSLVGSTVRHLPRLTLTTATGTGSTSVVGTPVFQFTAGDVLYVVEPYAIVTQGGTLAAADTVTVTIENHAVVSTATGSSLATNASLIAANINADAYLSQIVKAIASSTSVYVYAKNGISTYTIAVADSSGDLTTAISGSLTKLAIGSAVGTVSTVDTATNTITLTGNASVVLPVGTHVGVKTNQIYGLDPLSRDMTEQNKLNIACFTSSTGVMENNLPYIDDDVKRRFPKMNFQTLF